MYDINHDLQITLYEVNTASLPKRDPGSSDEAFRMKIHHHLQLMLHDLNLGSLGWISLEKACSHPCRVNIRVFMCDWYPSSATFHLHRTLDYYGSATLDLNKFLILPPTRQVAGGDIWNWSVGIHYSTLANYASIEQV